MKLGKRYLACLILAVVMVVSLGLFAACNNGKEPGDSSNNSTTSAGTQSTDTVKTPEELKGEYYCLDGAKEYKLSFADAMAVKLNLGNGDKQATFTFDGTKATWLYDGKTTTAKLSADGNSVEVKVDKSTYTFWRKVNYTVTYSVDGATIESSTTLNGTVAKKPTDPSKDGYYFVGWYKDAEFKETYSFETDVVTKDMTLYGRFIEYLATEFNVNLDLAYENAPKMEAVSTIQNKLEYNLPTPTRAGYKFIGWWMSAYDSAEKLTAQYTNQEIKENNTTLYAVWQAEDAKGGLYVSYDENGVKWNSLGVNVNYTVTISRTTSETGDVQESPQVVTKTEYPYAMKDLPAGDYKVEVEANGFTGVAYYKNKALDAVSLFTVDDTGTILTWNAVDNATNYYVSYECAGDAHRHNEFDNKNSTNFNFKNCDMPEGGFKFTVKATASGYSSSTSEVFVFDKALDAAKNLAVADGTKLTWDAVKNAQYYEVKVGDKTYYALTNEYSLENMTGALEIYVTAKARTFAPSTATKFNYTRQMLLAPQNVKVNGGEVTWDAVSGATSYVVTVDGKEVKVTTNAFTLEQGTHFDANLTTHTLTVQAEANDNVATRSLKTKEINFTVDTVNPLVYENGKLYWAMVDGATKYLVKVNDGEALELTANDYFAEVGLTKEGENTLQVAYVNAENVTSAYATLKIEAVALTIDLGTGASVETSTLYYEKGTLVNLNEVREGIVQDSFSFAGWYDTQNGRANNSARYYDDVPVKLNSSMTLYGAWLGEERRITLDLEGTSTLPENTPMEYVVRINEPFELPVPTTDDATKLFMGWYSEPNGVGVACTDENGGSKGYLFFTNMTFYPCWKSIFEFTEISNNDPNYPKAYSVSKGEAIGNVKGGVVTVPTMHKGLPITTVEANGFKGCSNIVSFNVPSTIKNVEKTAFTDCTGLTEVNVYAVEGATDDAINYESFQGVLIRRDKINGGKEIAYVPNAKTGSYEIPYGVTTIPSDAFKSKKITDLKIPATVTYIGSDAFYYNSTAQSLGLNSLEFLAEPDPNKGEVPLQLAYGAFNYVRKIKTFNLPARTALLDEADRWFFDLFYTGDILFYTETEAVNIVGNPAVDKDGNPIQTYTSKDGVVYKDNGATLVYYPNQRGGEFTSDAGVNRIEEFAFYKNRDINKVTISYDVTYIGKGAFSGCRNIKEVIFQGNADTADLTIGEEAFYELRYIPSIVLPACIKQIGKYAFGYCDKLTNVEVYFDDRIKQADGKVLIDGLAFTKKLTSASSNRTTYINTLYLGEHVPVIDINAIFGGSVLKTLNVDPNNPNYGKEEGDNVLYGKDANGNFENIAFFPATREGEYVVPTGVKTIGAYALNAKGKVTKITIPHTVTTIGDHAFLACTALTEVVFLPTPQGKEMQDLTIGNNAFASCGRLTELSFPERTVELGDQLILSSNKITTITLPTTLKNLVPSSDGSMKTFFSGTSSYLKTINVAEGSKYYRSIEGILYSLMEVKTTVGDQEVVEYVPNELIICPLQNDGVEGAVTIPSTVTRIWDSAFQNNQLVEGIFFEQRTENIPFTLGKNVFTNMANLTQLELPYGLTELKSQAIMSCPKLVTLRIPQTVMEVETRAFYNLAALEEVIFLDDTDNEANKAVDLLFKDGSTKSGTTHTAIFYNTNALKTIVLPVRGYKPLGAATVAEGDTTEPTTPTHGDLASIKIGHSAFTDLPALESITLTNNVVSLGDFVFEGTPLATITLPDSIKSMGKYVFSLSENLKTVTLPKDITVIPDYTFSGSSVETFTVGGNVTQIGQNAFASSKISNITFATETIENEDGTTTEKTSLTDIATYAFSGCSLLKTINLPASLRTIGKNAFTGTGLTSVTIPASVETIDEKAFYNSKVLAQITFEGTAEANGKLKTIGKNAFEGTLLTDISFPVSENNITLGQNLFGTKNEILNTIYLSESIIDIGIAFSGCTAIQKITVSDKSENFYADPIQPFLLSKNKDALRYYYGSINGTIDLFNVDNGDGNKSSTIIEIDEKVFENQTGLTSIVIPKTVTTIGQHAFKGCTALETVTFEKGSMLTTIGVAAFRECSSLKAIQIPKNVRELQGNGIDPTQNKEMITSRIFSKCSSLKTVTFEEGSVLEVIGRYTFENCTLLENIVIPSTVKTFGEKAFYQCKSLKEVTLPANLELTVDSKSVFDGASTLEVVNFPEKPKYTILPEGFFSGCAMLSSSTIGGVKQEGFVVPAEITEIGNTAFSGCASITKLTLSDSTTKIGNYAFRNTGIATMVLPNSINAIGNYAFSESDLVEIKLPSGLEQSKFGTNVFSKCLSLTTVDMTAATGLTTIPVSTFDGSPLFRYGKNAQGELVEFVIPQNIKELGNYAFRNTGLVNLVVPDSITKFGSGVFTNCNKLESIEYNATIMGSSMFKACKALTTVKFSDDTDIQKGSNAFEGCSSLKYSEYTDEKNFKPFVLPANATTVPSKFAYGTGITELTIPNSMLTLGSNAFASCDFLTVVTFPQGDDCKITALGASSFQNCELLAKVVNLPAKLTTYDKTVFSGCAFESFTIPKAWTSVPASFLAYNKKLTSVTFEGNDDGTSLVKTIDSSAFAYCKALTTITIPKTVATINTSAFSSCSALATVEFKDEKLETLTKIGASAFKDCTSLKKFKLPMKIAGTSKNTAASMYKEIFYGCTALEEVVFHENTNAAFDSIPNLMFRDCTSLKSVVIPKTIKTIGVSAFNGCTNLTSVTIENGSILATVDGYAFTGSGITSITLPNTVTEIKNYAFDDCPKLASVTINNTGKFKRIWNNAFSNCPMLQTFTLPNTMTKIEKNSFENSGLISIEIPASVTTIEQYAFNNCANLSNVTIKGEITEVSKYAFANTALTSIKLPLSVTAIRDYAFAGSKLTEFNISSQLTDIATTAFYGCDFLTKFTVAATNELYSFENDCMLMNSDGEMLMYLAGVNPPNGTVTITKDMKIAPHAFAGTKNVTTVIFEEGIETIGEYALYDADGLTEVILPSTLKNIGAYAFAECDMLSTIAMPNSVTTLGTKETSDAGVTTYTGYVFANTPSLKSINLSTSLEEVMPYTFDGSAITSVIIPDSVKVLCDYAFYNAQKLASVTFGANLESMGSFAFTGCYALTAVDIKGKDLVINDLAFGNTKYSSGSSVICDPLTNLKTITLGEGVKFVGEGAFRNTSVETLNIGGTVEELGKYAFDGSKSLTQINFADNSKLHTIGDYAFRYAKVTNVVFPEGLLYLGTPTFEDGAISNVVAHTFVDCTSLKSVTLPKSLKGLGAYAFDGCTELTEVNVTATEFVGGYIFNDCTKLETVNMVDGPTVLGSSTFANCTALKNVRLPETIVTVGSYAFKNCTALTELYIPETVTKVENYAFQDLTEATTVYFVNIEEPGINWTGTWKLKTEAKFVFNAKPKGENQPQPQPQPQP